MDDGFLHGRGRRVTQHHNPILLSSATTAKISSSFPAQNHISENIYKMLLKPVLLSALLSGFPAALANPIGEVEP